MKTKFNIFSFFKKNSKKNLIDKEIQELKNEISFYNISIQQLTYLEDLIAQTNDKPTITNLKYQFRNELASLLVRHRDSLMEGNLDDAW